MLYFVMQATSDMEFMDDFRSHSQFNDETFLLKLENGTLPPNLFDHEAHLRMAWLYVRKYGLKIALEKACSTIRSYDRLHGTGNKFHFTLTAASVKVVHHFMEKSKVGEFQEFVNEFPILKADFTRLLYQHYGPDVLLSSEAKTAFVEPDLLPFK